MFINVERRKDLESAIQVANQILPRLVSELRKREQAFLLSSASPQEIADLIMTFPHNINVMTYFTRNRRVMGYFTPARPTSIYLNRATFPRRTQTLVATFYHELVHAVDHFSRSHRFGHAGNRYAAWKEETAPFWIDALAERLAIETLRLDTPVLKNRGSWIEHRSWKTLWLRPDYIECVIDDEQSEHATPHGYEAQSHDDSRQDDRDRSENDSVEQ